MTDIKELRRLALDGDLAAMQEIILRLEAAEKSDAESIAMYRKARNERDALRAAVQHEADCVEAAKAEIEALRAKIAAMEQQVPARLVTAVAYRWRYRGAVMWQYGELTEETARLAKEHNHEVQALGILPGAQPAPSFADAYQGAMEEAAIWKKRALEAEDMNRKFIAEINGPTHMGEPAQPASKRVDGWREGVESAARLIDKKAELYAIRFGRDDIEGLSFGQGPHAEIKMDHYTRMVRLADEVRATLAASPEAKP